LISFLLSAFNAWKLELIFMFIRVQYPAYLFTVRIQLHIEQEQVTYSQEMHSLMFNAQRRQKNRVKNPHVTSY
jgi:hypothetical protein